MQSLRPKVGLITPSRTYVMEDDAAELNTERLAGCVTGLEDLGFTVVRDAAGFRNWRRYGGTDAERAAELKQALLDPDLDLVLPVRGGYGMTRLLPTLDFRRIAERKPLAMGFSDFTALNLALFSKAGLASWQGPMAGGLAPGYRTHESQIAFLEALTSASWRQEWNAGASDADTEREGVIWGGNLAMAASLIGTPWFPKPEQVKGGILFLEDVGEPPYRIDRMLLQLWEAGVLGSQSAVVLGCFTDADRHVTGDLDLRLEDVLSNFRERLARSGVAMVTGLPFGHIRKLSAVPVGVKGTLRVKSGRAELSADSVPVIGRGRDLLQASLDAVRHTVSEASAPL